MAAKKIDLSGFDEEIKKAKKPIDLSGFDEEVSRGLPKQKSSDFYDSTLGGAVSGLNQIPTMGFGDELSAAASAVFPTATDEEMGRGFVDRYKMARDAIRSDIDRAHEASPVAYNVAGLAGALGTAPLLPVVGGTGGAGLTGAALAKAAAIQGAKNAAVYAPIASLGSSKADLTEGDIGGALKDVAFGTAVGIPLGAGLSAGASQIPAAASWAKDQAAKLPDALRRVVDKVGSASKKLFADIQGIEPESIDDYALRGTELKRLRSLGNTTDEATKNFVETEVAPTIARNKSNFVREHNDAIDWAVENSNAKVPTSRIVDMFSKAKEQIAPEGIEGTGQVTNAVRDIDNAQSRVLNLLGSPAKDRAVDELSSGGYLTAKQLRTLNQQYESAAEKAYNPIVGGDPVLETAYKSLATQTNSELNRAMPYIVPTNRRLQASIEAQKDLARYGLGDKYGVDTDKLLGLFRASPKTVSLQKLENPISTMDSLFQTKLGDQLRLNQSMREIYPDISLSRYETGRSTYPGKLFGGISALFGNYGVGATIGDALSSAIMTRPLITAGYKARDAAMKAISGSEVLNTKVVSPMLQQLTNMFDQLPADVASKIGTGVLQSTLRPAMQMLSPDEKAKLIKDIQDSELPSTKKAKIQMELNKAR